MLGSALKASFSTEDTEVADFYFPDGVWCSVFNKSIGCIQGPSTQTMSSLIFNTYTHIKDGNIVPLQTDVVGHSRNVTKVEDLLKNPLELHIHTSLNEDMSCVATGLFISDDGRTLDVKGRQNVY